MKTTAELKSELAILVQNRTSFKGESEEAYKKRIRSAKKEAKMLREMILQVEAGVNEESVSKQLKEVRRWIKIMDDRYDQTKDGDKKLYEKKWGYSDKKRQIKWMMWMLKR